MWSTFGNLKTKAHVQVPSTWRWQLPPGGSGAATRELFLRGLSACYFAAFASFLVQVQGLYGPQGLMPANDHGLMEHQCLQGLVLACFGLCGCANVFVMYGMLALYKELVMGAQSADGGTFYNFQWDILLLEVGFMAAVLAPVLHSSLEPRPSGASMWMLRFILFKLMVMSGVVKLTTGQAYSADSWMQLTATWYHFATQCIPTPLGWYFHNLPMAIEKLFCATMFVIELPTAFLILVPIREVQVVAATLQIMLQMVIIVTGNYTFFNFLTICLACTLLDDSMIPKWFRPSVVTVEMCETHTDIACRSSEAQTDEETRALLGDQARGDEGVLPTSALASISTEQMQRLSGIVALVSLAFCGTWTIYESTPYGFNGTFTVSKSFDVTAWVSFWIPLALLFMSVVIPAVTCWDLFCLFVHDNVALLNREARAKLLRRPGFAILVVISALMAAGLLILRGVICFRMLSLMPGVLSQISPDIHSRTVSIWPDSMTMHSRMPFGLPHEGPHGYGLFRVMTGIGPHGEVARPEVVFEVQDAAKGVWLELQFPYKPGDVFRRPPMVAPYQPRLDWQMWFQALYLDNGDINEWFDALIGKILAASPPVLALLDSSTLPDVDIKALRVKFYSYNFTHYGEGGAWWHRTPRQVQGEDFDYSKEAKHPVNLAREVQKALTTWHHFAVLGFAGLALSLCFAPHVLRRATSVKQE